MTDHLVKLNEFLGKAALATYAGGGGGLDLERAEEGMTELEYGKKEDEWYYKDSYTGFFQSWGREVVWFKGKPFWAQVYGGGMKTKFLNDVKFTHKAFDFLKKALSSGDKISSFQPRGPKKFYDQEWEYICNWEGTIRKFSGSEKILFNGQVIFTYNFSGGLYIFLD
ncbi:MAG: hypothetical protein KAX09_03350 [Candidatus Heimdallarchaeota archaeon]|nr:hypothetical protein [Candidatus Heimdallarchaeota archaeon]MCK4289995.1 hypothetical protein [Candidatus Heimdallarchaeota archaeon]